jgi:hypothetical protein
LVLRVHFSNINQRYPTLSPRLVPPKSPDIHRLKALISSVAPFPNPLFPYFLNIPEPAIRLFINIPAIRFIENNIVS